MAETHLPGGQWAFMADSFVARGVADHLAAALPHPPRVTTNEINLWGNMIADSSPPELQTLRVSRQHMLLLTGSAGRSGLLATTIRARPAPVSTN